MSKKVLLVVPSTIIARGLEQIFNDLGEFEVSGILSDLSGSGETQVRTMDVDVIIVDPSVFDHASRPYVRNNLASLTSAAVLALESSPWDEESLKQYDGVISLYDAPTTVIRKVRSALEGHSVGRQIVKWGRLLHAGLLFTSGQGEEDQHYGYDIVCFHFTRGISSTSV